MPSWPKGVALAQRDLRRTGAGYCAYYTSCEVALGTPRATLFLVGWLYSESKLILERWEMGWPIIPGVFRERDHLEMGYPILLADVNPARPHVGLGPILLLFWNNTSGAIWAPVEFQIPMIEGL